MIQNKKTLLDSMNRNKDKNSVLNVVNNHKVVYNNECESLYEIASFIDNTSINSADKKLILNTLFSKINESANTKTLYKTCSSLLNKSGISECVASSLDLFSKSLIIQNREDMTKNNSELIKRKINIGKIIETFKLDKSNTYHKFAIYELCNLISSQYSDIPKNEQVKICSETIKYIFKENNIVLTDKEILVPITEYFLSFTDTKIVEEGLNSILLLDKKYILESIGDISASEIKRRKIRDSQNDMLPVELQKNISIENIQVKDAISNNDTDTLFLLLKNMTDEELFIFFNTHRLQYVYSYHGAEILHRILNNLITQIIEESSSDEINRYLKAISDNRLYYNKMNNFIDNKYKSYNELLSDCKDRLQLALKYPDILKRYHEDPLLQLGSAVIVIEDAINNNVILNENTVKRLLLTSKEKLKAIAGKLSSTEKQASRTIDANIARISDAFVKSSQLDNRERVIEGKILPSASKIIKLVILTGATALVSQAVAVIGVLAIIAISKKTRDRERQFILDEIKIHLRLAEKKIEQAEMRGDDKALEVALKIESKLQRELQRIEYRQRIYRGKQYR